METLIKQLEKGLVSEAVEIKRVDTWALPVSRLEVRFKRVKQAQMDILMKMLLMTIEETPIRRAAQAAELLLVEELFIADLMENMQRTGLIQPGQTGFMLTDKGKSQLAQGLIEEELPEEDAALFYSAHHGEYWPAVEATNKETETWPLYRYAAAGTPDAAQVLAVLAKEKNTIEENGLRAMVSGIVSLNETKAAPLPFVEFQLYNREQDIFYARVWHVAGERWDKPLEEQIEARELPEWRERFPIEET